MKLIKDIRLFKCEHENADGSPLPESFAPKNVNITMERIVFKLREKGFSLGDFDHLYVNFTPLLPEGEIRPSPRSIDKYHPWYRYFDHGVSAEDFFVLEQKDDSYFAERVMNILLSGFSDSDEAELTIRNSVQAALNLREKMTVKFKEKRTPKLTAAIYLSINAEGRYVPGLSVTENSGRKEILHETLPECTEFSWCGSIQLSSKMVRIAPRKSSYSVGLEPIEFEFEGV